MNSLYLRGIDEKIKIPVLEEAIRKVCEPLGEIVEVIAKKNLRARGQAFVVFSNVDDADDAREFLQEETLFGRKIIVDFAKSKSDAVVKMEGGEEALEAHKAERLAQKGTLVPFLTHARRCKAMLIWISYSTPSSPPGRSRSHEAHHQ